MPVETLSAGPVYAITNNTIRALPPRISRLFVTFSTATSVDVSNDPTMANPQNYLPADFKSAGNAGIWCTASFIRVNGGNALVSTEV
jgi:hypothetical protein